MLWRLVQNSNSTSIIGLVTIVDVTIASACDIKNICVFCYNKLKSKTIVIVMWVPNLPLKFLSLVYVHSEIKNRMQSVKFKKKKKQHKIRKHKTAPIHTFVYFMVVAGGNGVEWLLYYFVYNLANIWHCTLYRVFYFINI